MNKNIFILSNAKQRKILERAESKQIFHNSRSQYTNMALRDTKKVTKQMKSKLIGASYEHYEMYRGLMHHQHYADKRWRTFNQRNDIHICMEHLYNIYIHVSIRLML